MPKQYNVLFLCTGNSARSIMAEALRQLESARIPAWGAHSKPWDEFAKPDSAKLDFVFTVCDQAAKEVCPVWPGQPMTAHWGIPDPAAVEGTPEEVTRAFREAFLALDRRISLFLALPIEKLSKLALQKEVDDIGRISDAPATR